jgi:hypothetical protein
VSAGTLNDGQIVSPAPLTITADNQTMVYGGTLPTLTVAYMGLVNGDSPATFTASPTVAPAPATVPATSDVGDYAITVDGASDPNYTITYAGGTLHITRAPLKVAVANAVKSFGVDDSAELTGTLAGLQNGDHITATYASAGTGATAAPGKYAIDAVLKDWGTGKLALDYDVTILPGVFTVLAQNGMGTHTQLHAVYGERSPFASRVQFTATVTSDLPGGGTPTGSVTFYDGTTVLGTTKLKDGVASFALDEHQAHLAVGAHIITAQYNGDQSFQASTYLALTLTVLSAQEQVTQLAGWVNNLVKGRVLTSNDASPLLSAVDTALANLDAGDTPDAVSQLQAFLSQVNAAPVARKLQAWRVTWFTGAANRAIASALSK